MYSEHLINIYSNFKLLLFEFESEMECDKNVVNDNDKDCSDAYDLDSARFVFFVNTHVSLNLIKFGIVMCHPPMLVVRIIVRYCQSKKYRQACLVFILKIPVPTTTNLAREYTTTLKNQGKTS